MGGRAKDIPTGGVSAKALSQGRRHIREKLKEAGCGGGGEGAREAVGGAEPKQVQSHTSEKRACTLFFVGCESLKEFKAGERHDPILVLNRSRWLLHGEQTVGSERGNWGLIRKPLSKLRLEVMVAWMGVVILETKRREEAQGSSWKLNQQGVLMDAMLGVCK